MKNHPIKPQEIWPINKLRNKLQDERTIRDFFLFNMVDAFYKTGKIPAWLPNFVTPECIAIWVQYRDWWARPLENTIKDFEKLTGHTPRQLIDPAKSHPIVIKRTLGGYMHINSLTVLFKDLNLKSYWECLSDDQLLRDFIFTLDKYQAFFEIETGIMKKVLEHTHTKV